MNQNLDFVAIGLWSLFCPDAPQREPTINVASAQRVVSNLDAQNHGWRRENKQAKISFISIKQILNKVLIWCSPLYLIWPPK